MIGILKGSSIYNGNAIYNDGTGGGGGGGETYPADYSGPISLGGKTYQTVKIGNKIWMSENLDYRWEGLSDDMTILSAAANYYNGDSSLYGDNGLIYNGYAVLELVIKLSNGLLDGWRVPDDSDFLDIPKEFIKNDFNPYGVAVVNPQWHSPVLTNLKSSDYWDGNNSFGFNLRRCGLYQGGWVNIENYTCLWIKTGTGHYDFGNGNYITSNNNNPDFGCSIRLCKNL